jgi:hypothetical protein
LPGNALRFSLASWVVAELTGVFVKKIGLLRNSYALNKLNTSIKDTSIVLRAFLVDRFHKAKERYYVNTMGRT